MNRGCGCAVLKVQSVTHFLFSAPDAVYFQSWAWVCSAPSRPFSCSVLCCMEADSESLHLQALVPTGSQLSSAGGWQALVGRLEVGVRGEKSGYLSLSLLPSALFQGLCASLPAWDTPVLMPFLFGALVPWGPSHRASSLCLYSLRQQWLPAVANPRVTLSASWLLL